MKILKKTCIVKIPAYVDFRVKGNKITVGGTHGTLTRDFSQLALHFQPSTNIACREEERSLAVSCHICSRKRAALVKTVASHITNMIRGVTRLCFARCVAIYSHFPVEVLVETDGSAVQVNKFMSKFFRKRFEMPLGVKVRLNEKSEFNKGKEFVLEGTDLERVSNCAHLIARNVRVKNKDKRVFLDGIYVAAKGFYEKQTN